MASLVERDLVELRELGLSLAFTLDTHVHADHVSGACRLRTLTGCKVAFPAMERLECADLGVEEGTPVRLGELSIHPLHTPGHTATHHAYHVNIGDTGRLFTGDALLIDGCGRTDFQGGSATALYHSVRGKLFNFPDDALIFPGHDYHGRRVSSVGQERARNPRLRDGVELPDFERTMAALGLARPRKMDVALPANLACGACGDEVLASLRAGHDPDPQGVG